MKKKILFVIDSLCSGGAEKSLISLLTLFDYKQFEVDLLMFSPKGLYLPLLPKEVNVLDVPLFIKKQNSGIKNLLLNWDFKQLYLRFGASISLRNPRNKKTMHSAQINWRWISKGIDKINKNYDVAIAYSQGTPTYYVAEKVNAFKKLCWINTDYKKASYNKKFDLKYYEKYDKVVAVSDFNQEVIIKEMPSIKEKTQVVYDIVSPQLIRSMAFEDGGFSDNFDGVRILTIGRLVEAKGYDMAIEACYKLKKQGYKVKWYVIGEGILKEKLGMMIKDLKLDDTFIFIGTYQNPYVFLKQCDIYVQPSRFEGYGLAIAEARVLGKPIVATDFTIVHNQIRDGENGLIVGMNSEGIYKGIKRYIDDKSLQQRTSLYLKGEKIGTEEEIDKVYSLINLA